MRLIWLIVVLAAGARAQGPGVPVYEEGRAGGSDAVVLERAEALRVAGKLTAHGRMTEQMKRASCALNLPEPGKEILTGRERWERARAAHLRVGFHYLCTKCEQWHLNLAGGYAITEDGAVATCAHVIEAPARMREGFLIAVTDEDEVLAVTEVLAMDRGRDTAILRVRTGPMRPLPLALDAAPGDAVWCFSDPAGKRGYFSEGIVSRFVRRPFLRRRQLAEGEEAPRPVWLETTTDWAPGSSGSAVIDARGNCAGHVSEIQALMEEPGPRTRARSGAGPVATHMVAHQAISAAEVRAMVRGK